MNRVPKALLVAAAALLMTLSAHAADPDQPTQTIFKALMAATLSNDYDGFVALCDDRMKAAMTPTMIEGVSKQIAPLAKAGYDADYLGALNQRGFAVHLWRLRFTGGGDDILATLSIKDGKAGGFYLH